MKRFILAVATILSIVGLMQQPLTAAAPDMPESVKAAQVQQTKPVEAPEPPPAPEPVPEPTPTPEPAPAAPVAVPEPEVISGCGDDQYAAFIYQHESGCNTQAVNAGGCLGIGQACPGSKLTAACPNLDYYCQNQFFTGYAVSRYGSWYGAYTFWVNNGWW